MLDVEDANKTVYKMRAVIDTGAQDSFISKQAVKDGKWIKSPVNISVGSFSEKSADGDSVEHRLKISVKGHKNDQPFVLYPLEVPHMAGSLIQPPMSESLIRNIKQHQPLADPDAMVTETSELHFQIIIGNDMANAVYQDISYRYTSIFVLKNTVFGIVFSGPIPDFNIPRKTGLSVFSVSSMVTSQCI